MAIDYSSDPAVNNFREYLRIASVHPNVNYDECLTFLRRQAQECGLTVQEFEPVPKKPVLVMTWTGEEPTLPSILLLSHMDVVPVAGQDWDYPPFEARLIDGRIYARGSQDMKAHAMQTIEAVRRLKKNNIKMKRTVHLCFVPDEEVGGFDGMATFVKTDAYRSLNVGFCIDEGSGSPGDEIVVYNGAKSIWHIEVTCRGQSGHGSLMFPNTCGEKIRYIIDKFMDLRKEYVAKVAASGKPNLLALGDVISVNLTMLRGGEQNNVIPDKMVASFDLRLPPFLDFDQFENQIKQWCEEAGEAVTFDFQQKDPKPKDFNLDEVIYWQPIKDTLDKMKIPYLVGIFPAGNDSRFVRELGTPAIGLSPLRHTPVAAHARNESLLVSVFLEGITVFENIIPAMCNA
ncbi:aminoacylase-1-like [Aricia agestis]|uniref:aminoacylase-1-like n=1 Tax=Aricia agestis TaxID=91739 RepID=UPI001C20957F|nr:aminoacylase-1-like [Aricia agestis]